MTAIRWIFQLFAYFSISRSSSAAFASVPTTRPRRNPCERNSAALGPTLVAPAQVASGRVAGTIDVGVRRDGPFWWFVLTGIDTDGRRYRLSDGEGLPVRVEGTIADWLNAPG